MANVTERYNISAGRPYTTRDGEQKKQWVNLGRAVKWDDGGISLEFTSMPVGNWWDGKASLFVQDEQSGGQRQGGNRQQSQGQRQAPAQSTTSPGDYTDDDIAF